MKEYEAIASLFDDFLIKYDALATESIRHMEEEFDHNIADKLTKHQLKQLDKESSLEKIQGKIDELKKVSQGM